MAKNTLEQNVQTAIADLTKIKHTLCEKHCGITEETPSCEFADGINNVYSNGYNYGYNEGKSAQWNEFWDAMQGEGRRSNYTGAFEGIGWTAVTLRPKYNMKKIQYASRMFRLSRVEQSFNDYFWNMGIDISFSQCVQMDSCFASSFWTKIDYLETESCDNLESLFSGCTKLTKVGLELKGDGSQNMYNTFNKCSALKDVSIYYGKIGFDGIDFSGCPNLTVQSLVNIFKALVSSNSSPTIKVGSTNLAKLTEEQKAIATNKGWKLK